MECRERNDVQLAEDIGTSPTSVRKIAPGQSQQQQVTLSRLMKRLCTPKLGDQSNRMECKYNLPSDMENSVISARLIQQQFNCDQVYIVVPFYEEDDRDDLENEEEIRILPLQDLAEELGLRTETESGEEGLK